MEHDIRPWGEYWVLRCSNPQSKKNSGESWWKIIFAIPS